MKTLCPPGYHHNVFVATHTIGYMIESYRLLLLMNQRLLYKPIKERNVSSHKWSTTQRLLEFHRRFVTTNGFLATLALGQMIYDYTYIMYCCIYVMPILLLKDLNIMCFLDHLRPLILRSLFGLLSILCSMFHWYQLCLTIH